MRNPVNFEPRRLVDGIAALAWPSRCLLCGDPGRNGRDLCTTCTHSLPWNRRACGRCALPLASDDRLCGACLLQPPPLDAVHAAFVYGYPLDRLLPRLKFHRGLAPGRLLSQLMATAFAEAERPDAIVPVPLHRSRLRSRGYDQALELARPLAKALDITLRTDLLVRGKATTPQSRLDAAARHRNLRGAFTAPFRTTPPAHVVLLDDVMTTGATLHAAARTLRKAGVQRIDAWVCARVP